MNKYILSFTLITSPIVCLGQTILSNNNTSVILTPEGIQIKPDSNYNSTNVALGNAALSKNKADENVAIGDSALSLNVFGKGNVAIGYKASKKMQWGTFNVAVGRMAMGNAANTVEHNVALGAHKLYNTNTGYQVAIGYNALTSNTSGQGNVAVGFNSLASNLSGHSNTTIGNAAMYLNKLGNSNVAIGTESMYKSTDGISNIAIGNASLKDFKLGKKNIGIGAHVMSSMENGNRNIAIGDSSFSSSAVLNNNLSIGYKAGSSSNGDFRMYIENSGLFEEQPLIGGVFYGPNQEESRRVGINRLMPELLTRNEIFQVNGEAFKSSGGGNWVTTSDRRLKKHIVKLNSEEILHKILTLQGVNYKWKDQSKGLGIQYGFIAQEIREVFPTKVFEDKEGYLSASYGDFDPFLVEAIKALKQEIDSIKTELTEVKKSIENQNGFAISTDSND